ncbi:MAG: undecaprenyl/decaprenyl-phosphate alpha-N-acetylglucosaminyl 1-phosphate transferase [Acidobacteria bacterium]|nr:undecaprenyl/decaprenyl-phosphate alpha-N-acetylglucosaminyl 1-phosphate transferase [Acidobacteriota bacterium]
MSTFLIALAMAAVLTPLVRRVAMQKGWVSHSSRAITPPALMGGVAVLAAVAGALLLSGRASVFAHLWSYWLCVVVMFFMGLVDDLLVLTPRIKLTVQLAVVAVFMVLLSLEGKLIWGLWTPVFSFWLLGITNALNLLDNMDGLAAGVGGIAALGVSLVLFSGESGVSFLSFQNSAASPGVTLLALAGGLAGFLLYNFRPARIYLGDSGSHVLGFSLAALPLYRLVERAGYEPGHMLALPLLLLIPICDTTYVTLSRLRRGVPIFQGGKDHLSHRLVRAGFSETQVALLFYAAAILLVALTWLVLVPKS